MRNNQPVTSVETLLPDNLFIYSTTDLKGVITSVNDAFVEISGFSREELVGKAHNIVRHPDMPEVAFADLWRDLKAGRPWCGLVKNRRKDGGYYWVEANASPIRENGTVVGYGSVRRRPSRAAVQAAEAVYAKIRQGQGKLSVRHGQPWAAGWLAGFSRFGLIARIRLALVLGLAAGGGLLAAPQLAMPGLLWGSAGLLLVALAIPLLIWLPRLFKDLQRVAGEMNHMQSTGDFSAHVVVKGQGLLSAVAQGINALAIDVETVLHETQSGARRVADGASSLQQAMQHVSEAQASLANSSTAAAATLEQITVAINEAAMNALEGVDASQENQRTSTAAGRAAEDAVAEIGQIADRVRSAGDAVSTLSQRSQEIGSMAGVIKDIADQTNLLALNAAIEAARAGEQGRGFAVVADEVRKLAERTAKATMEIDTTIQAIQNEIGSAVGTMEESCSLMGDGVQRVQSVRDALSLIQTTSQRALERAQAIADASKEQGVAANDIARNVEHIAQAIDTQSADIAAIEQLTADFQKTSDLLRRKLTHFRLNA
ncbi:MAG TPA: methyl-accepting chemotaxis protein [Azonexus sp.]|nr:methyl-accepting chemotaxis protein [Azonexus sp.]